MQIPILSPLPPLNQFFSIILKSLQSHTFRTPIGCTKFINLTQIYFARNNCITPQTTLIKWKHNCPQQSLTIIIPFMFLSFPEQKQKWFIFFFTWGGFNKSSSIFFFFLLSVIIIIISLGDIRYVGLLREKGREKSCGFNI